MHGWGSSKPAHAESTRRKRAWRRHADRYGAASAHEGWHLVRRHYDDDQLAAAMDLALSLGAGPEAIGLSMYRLVEAEALTREHAERWRVTPWLELEAIPTELPFPRDTLDAAVLEACAEVAQRLGWTHGPPVLLTLFAEAANAPWAPDRQGFCVDKQPYAKICLPHHLLHRPEELAEAVRHEITHVVMLNLGEGRVPRWLDEAAAMTMGGWMHGPTLHELAEYPDDWLNPEDLDEAYQEDREDQEGAAIVWDAYQQSGWIGRWLAAQAGEPVFAALARGCAPRGFFAELRLRVSGASPADDALQREVGHRVQAVFDLAQDALIECYGPVRTE